MLIDFNQTIKQIDGTELTITEGKEATLKHFALEALQLNFQDETNLSADTKCKRWLLATRIYANPAKIDLTAEEIVEIKKLIGKAYGPMIVGQAFQMLEGK